MDSKIAKSPFSVSVPAIDIPSYVFTSGSSASRKAPQYFDAADPTKCYSLAEAEIIVKQLGLGLQKFGLKRGDRVLLYSGNHLFFPIALWSILAAGCIFTAASPSATEAELEYQLKDCGASVLLAGRDGLRIASKAAEKAGLPLGSVYYFHDPADLDVASTGIQSWTTLFCEREESQAWTRHTITSIEDAKSTTAVINYSSGTTGPPKGVELSHYNIIANTEQVIFKRSMTTNTTAGRARKARLETSGERWLAVVPMYHAFGQTYFAVTAPRIAAKVFVVPKFDLLKYLLYLDIYRITFINAVPTIYNMMNKLPDSHRFNLKAVENVTNGSAALDPLIGAGVASKYLRKETKIKQGWGMTETTCSVLGFAPDDVDDGRSIGWLHPNCMAKIVPVAEGESTTSADKGNITGEIWVAGPNIMKGYWKRPEATAEAFVQEDGVTWLRTGDIGYVDERGCFYIIDRLKELIKVKGLQVAPAELEQCLMGHPAVVDCAVVGAKINGNEYPRAFVVRNGNPVTADELFNMIKTRFASHKWLTGGIYFIDSIPRTASGKVKRRELPKMEDKILSKL